MISKLITKKFTIENEELAQLKINENKNEDQYFSISYDLALQFSLIIKTLRNNDHLK